MTNKKLPRGIDQRPNGLYRGRFKVNGEQYEFYDRDLKSLQERMEEKRVAIRQGTYHKEDSISFGAWFDVWISTYKRDLKINSQESYKQVFNVHARKQFGNRRLKDIQSEEIQSYFNSLLDGSAKKKPLSESHCNKLYAIFKGMFRQAYILKKINIDPMTCVTPPKKKKRAATNKQPQRKALTREETGLFLGYAKGSQYYDLYMIALATGCRIGELLALRWNNILFSSNTIQIRGTLIYPKIQGGNGQGHRFIDSPKTISSCRDIPMLAPVAAMLKQRRISQMENRELLGPLWKEEPGLENAVFTYPGGGIFWDTGIRVDMKKIVERIQIEYPSFPHISPHWFRHTFASRWIEEGGDLKTLQMVLGHSSFQITMDTYSHILPDKKEAEMSKIGGLLIGF